MPSNENRQWPCQNAENKPHQNAVQSGDANKEPFDGDSHAHEILISDYALGSNGSKSLPIEEARNQDDDDNVISSGVVQGHIHLKRKPISRRKCQKKHSSSLDTPQVQRLSLLSKLLKRDAGKENSHLLQCLRFIVNNSFLQSSSPTLHFT
jgi:hypothetical protein